MSRKILLTLIFIMAFTLNAYADPYQILNQYNKPQCSVYAVVGAVQTQYQMQSLTVPAIATDDIFKGAKEIDDHPELDSTFIPYALRSAQSQGFISYYTQINLAVTDECLAHNKVVIINQTWGNAMHATYLIDFVDGSYIAVNSWGEQWGDNGTYKLTQKQFDETVQDAWFFEVTK